MVTFLGITLTYEALAFFLLFLVSEAVGANPKLKDNSVVQLIVRLATLSKGFRKEDDKIEEIKRTLRGGR
jgi:hypothetical protein